MILFSYPRLLLIVSFVVMALATLVGDYLRRRMRPLEEKQRKDLDLVLGAALTVLGLLIGFTFSMSISRYDQRKHYEESEANAIGTEYLRANLLPASEAERTRALLRKYLRQRVLFYTVRDQDRLKQILSESDRLQGEMWNSVRTAAEPPTAISALVISGMNDVLNSEGYTQASWWNRIPGEAWLLMSLIGIGCSAMIAYSAYRRDWRINLILPLGVALSFFLIADIDSPRGGFIHVSAENLTHTLEQLDAPATVNPSR